MPRIYEEQCELFIEQEISEFIESSSPDDLKGSITKKADEIQSWVLRTFNRTLNRDTVRQRIYRKLKSVTMSQPCISTSTPLPDREIQEKPTETVRTEGGLFDKGTAPGPGRPPKFAVIPDNTQFRTSGTGENEWYTPMQYIEAAREVLGEIDLDPATSDFGQKRIKAAGYFTAREDGLSLPWNGRVWLNPPYSQPLIQQFIEKLISEYSEGRMVEGLLLTHNYTDTKWFHLAESKAARICFTMGRVRFEKADGSLAAPTQGQAFFYYGDRGDIFRDIFVEYGFVR